MRALIIIAGVLTLGLSLGACKNNDQTDNTQNVDENLTAENIVSNDVTAIDAVTGDASNMAADSDVNDLGNISNSSGNVNSFPKAKPQTVSPKSLSAPTTKAASNTTSNAATNAAE